MRLIDHIVPKEEWDQAPPGPYRAASLATEGFIHCANRQQTAWVANSFYASQAQLLVLVIDADRFGHQLRDEDPGIGQTFPHVYGPIERDAIVRIDRLERDAAGQWLFPSEPS